LDRRISEIQLTAPQVLATETSHGGGRPGTIDRTPGRPFAIQRTTLSQGEFTYARIQKGNRAEVHARAIEGVVDSIGSFPDLLHRTTEADVSGVIENSGTFRLRVALPFFERRLDLWTNLEALDLRLNDFSPFSQLLEGIRLEGLVHYGSATFHIQERTLTGAVNILYNHLKIEMGETQLRSPLQATVMNVVNWLQVFPSDLTLPSAAQSRSVARDQDAHETTLQLLLHGLKDGFIAVAHRR
ncbi:MAG TPA: hypothetical protein VL588_11885, partial [Bdellovibrionota bacterium]|nr:hypothetical protein [Bdellovibrionota bacterium]